MAWKALQKILKIISLHGALFREHWLEWRVVSYWRVSTQWGINAQVNFFQPLPSAVFCQIPFPHHLMKFWAESECSCHFQLLKTQSRLKTAHLHEILKLFPPPLSPGRSWLQGLEKSSVVSFPLCCSSPPGPCFLGWERQEEGMGGRRRLSMVEGQCWGGGIFNLGLVQSGSPWGWRILHGKQEGRAFWRMLSSTWVSSHRRTHSQWRWQSPPSTWVMVPSLLCMEALLTCHSSWLPSFHASYRWSCSSTEDFPLCSPRASGAGMWIPLVLPSQSSAVLPLLAWGHPQKPYRNFWTRSSQRSLLSPMSSHGEKWNRLTRSILRLAALMPSPHIPWPLFSYKQEWSICQDGEWLEGAGLILQPVFKLHCYCQDARVLLLGSAL